MPPDDAPDDASIVRKATFEPPPDGDDRMPRGGRWFASGELDRELNRTVSKSDNADAYSGSASPFVPEEEWNPAINRDADPFEASPTARGKRWTAAAEAAGKLLDETDELTPDPVHDPGPMFEPGELEEHHDRSRESLREKLDRLNAEERESVSKRVETRDLDELAELVADAWNGVTVQQARRLFDRVSDGEFADESKESPKDTDPIDDPPNQQLIEAIAEALKVPVGDVIRGLVDVGALPEPETESSKARDDIDYAVLIDELAAAYADREESSDADASKSTIRKSMGSRPRIGTDTRGRAAVVGADGTALPLDALSGR